MKRKIISVLIVLAVLASVITSCTTKDSYLVRIMKLAPEDTTRLSCVDTELMVNDPDFRFLYDDVISGGFIGMSYQTAGIDVSEIYTLGYISGWDEIDILIGDFNLGDIRDALMNEGFIEDEYQGVEIWIHNDDDAVAFIGDMVISGYTDGVQACIRIDRNMESSLYDNEDMKSVIDKLPSAPLYMLLKTDDMNGSETMCGGMSISNMHSDDEKLDISAWFKFDSETNAESSVEDMEDFVGYWFEATNVESELSGQFIEIIAETEIPED